jgi:hypothetical protein
LRVGSLEPNRNPIIQASAQAALLRQLLSGARSAAAMLTQSCAWITSSSCGPSARNRRGCHSHPRTARPTSLSRCAWNQCPVGRGIRSAPRLPSSFAPPERKEPPDGSGSLCSCGRSRPCEYAQTLRRRETAKPSKLAPRRAIALEPDPAQGRLARLRSSRPCLLHLTGRGLLRDTQFQHRSASVTAVAVGNTCGSGVGFLSFKRVLTAAANRGRGFGRGQETQAFGVSQRGQVH